MSLLLILNDIPPDSPIGVYHGCIDSVRQPLPAFSKQRAYSINEMLIVSRMIMFDNIHNSIVAVLYLVCHIIMFRLQSFVPILAASLLLVAGFLKDFLLSLSLLLLANVLQK